MKIDFDSSDFEKRMKIYGAKQEAVILKTLSEQAMDLRKHAAATAPLLEGLLSEGIVEGKAERVSGGYEATVHAGVGNSRAYALRQHEELRPAPQFKMKPGPKTFMKPMLPWGMAGGKYLTRPLMYHLKIWAADMAKKLEAIK